MRRLAYPIIVSILSMLVLVFAWFSFSGGFFNFGKETKSISNHNIVLEKIEKMGKLQLVKYKFKDVLEQKIEYDWWPDSKAILIISGEATGCMDLEKVKPEDIVEQGDSILIRLPEPEICDTKINHSETSIYDTKTYSFDESKLIDRAFKAAEQQIAETARKSNILEQARNNGELVLRPIFEQISQKKVIFSYALDTKNTDLRRR
ncbi:MAG: DUF4230 domain-containing protein [Microscillaceae bacterium]|nr:DUF4230 domain-containing protein [Microscillaceae bacterium]